MTPNLELINLKIAFGEFDPEQSTDAEAMHLLEECIRLKYSPPSSLLPYVGKAIDAWGEARGNKTAYKNTKGEWSELIWHVHFYYVTSAAKKDAYEILEDAIELVVEQFPTVNGKDTTYDTLEAYYNKAESRATKNNVEQKFGSRKTRLRKKT